MAYRLASRRPKHTNRGQQSDLMPYLLFHLLGIKHPHSRLFDFSHTHYTWKRLVNDIDNGCFDYRRYATLLMRFNPL